MNRRMHISISSFCPALAGMLCMALAAGAHAATDSASVAAPAAAPQSGGEVVELKEVWVYGKKLAARIADAEDDFFRLYNKLNRNSDYHITCGDISLERGSMIMTRVCVPEFLATTAVSTDTGYYDGYYDYVGYYQAYNTAGCTGGRSSMTRYEADGLVYTSNLGNLACSFMPTYHRGSRLAGTGYYSIAAASPEMRSEYAANVLKVIKSDPQLLAKAVDLAVLYGEMETTQANYAEARKSAKKATPRNGPRVAPGPHTF